MRKTSSMGIFILFICIFPLALGGCGKKTKVSVESLPEQSASPELSEPSVSQEDAPLEVIRPEDELLLMVRSDYEPFMWLDENGELTGWIVDVERAIWHEAGQKIREIPYTDAGKATQDVKSGVTHALVGTPYTPDYERIFHLGNPWIFLELMVFVERDREDIGGATIDECIQSLFGKKVGVQARGIEYNLLRDYKDIQLIEYETGTVAIRRMAEGVVDAKLEMMQPALYQAKKENLRIKPVGVPLMTVKGSLGFYKGLNPEIIDRYNAAVRTIVENGTYDKIYEQWFGE